MDKVIRDALRWRFLMNYSGYLHNIESAILPYVCSDGRIIDEGMRYEELAGIAGVIFWAYKELADREPIPNTQDAYWYQQGKTMYDSAMRIPLPKDDTSR